MEDYSATSMSYPGKLERVFQDKRARTLISCYVIWQIYRNICEKNDFRL